MESGKKQLEAKINDCLRLCGKYASPKFTCFLTEEEQAYLGNIAGYDCNIGYFGGYGEAKRKMFGAFPEWQEVDFGEYPIQIVSLLKKYPKELTHRDYLGTVLSLGIERSNIGDILVHEGGAYIFAADSVAGFIAAEIDKVANCGIKTEIVGLKDIKIPEQEYDDLFCVVASMRLDAFVGAVTKLSRSKALLLIRSGKVSLNHRVLEDGAKGVSVGDVLSVRGYGRYIVHSEGGRTGSGRLHVHIKKFR